MANHIAKQTFRPYLSMRMLPALIWRILRAHASRMRRRHFSRRKFQSNDRVVFGYEIKLKSCIALSHAEK